MEGLLQALETEIGRRAIHGYYRVAVTLPADVDAAAFCDAVRALDLHVHERPNGVLDVWWDALERDFYYAQLPDDKTPPVALAASAQQHPQRVPYLSLRARTGARPVLCIVGAAGTVGRATLRHLVAAQAHRSFDIRCTGDLAHDFPQVQWFGNVRVLDRDMCELFLVGCSALFCSFSHTASMSERIEQAEVLFEAAKRQAVPMVTMLSVAGADRSVMEWHAHEFARLERVLHNSGLPACVVRAALFMETLLSFASSIEGGLLELPLGDGGRAPLVALDDVGRFCATIIMAKERYANTAFTLTGDASYSGAEIAAALSTALDRTVRYEPNTSDERVRMLMSAVPAWEQDRFLMWAALLRDGKSAVTCTDALSRVTAHKALTLDAWLHSVLERFGPAQDFPGVPLRGLSVLREGALKGSLAVMSHDVSGADDATLPGFAAK